MMKIAFLALLGLITLLILAIIAITATIDPNDYKTDIESAVAQNTTLKLTIDGNLGWSFIPLGIDVNKVVLKHQDEKPFTKLNQLTAQVGFLSLLKFNPQVHKIILDGLEVTLEKNEQGVASWENITKIKKSKNQDNPIAQKPSAKNNNEPTLNTNQEQTSKDALKLEIIEIAITNTTIHYLDKQSNQSASLKDFNLLANSISFDREFPINIEFKVSSSNPQLDIDAKINAAIIVGSNMKHFEVKELQSSYKLAGEALNKKEVSASLNGNSIIADLTKDTVTLNKVAIAFSNLILNTDLEIHDLSSKPKLNGTLNIPNFSLQAFLASLGQPNIETADPNVLTKLGFSTELDGSSDDLTLSNLAIKLDDTNYTGTLNYRSTGQFVSANIKGTELNIDRYLPPPADPIIQVADSIASSTGKEPPVSKGNNATLAKSNQPEPQLLPLETIRSLNLDISFIQDKLIAKNLKLNDLIFLMNARNGLINLSEASGKLYEGSFDVNVKIDATSNNPTWVINKNVNNIQILPLLKDFQNLEIISGGINLNADVKAKGNTVSALRKSTKGKANFDFDKGALHGFNLTKLACEGVALINRDKVTKTDWTKKSDFQAMKGSFTIDGNTFTNNNLTAAMSGLALIGKGAIDAELLDINYGVDLKVVGDLGDNACRVNEKVKDLAIPIICKGSLIGDPAKLCKLDYNRVQELVTAAGKKELERKANKEVDKQLDKYLGDDKSETKKGVKNLIKGLF